ncbi:MAG TPA: MerR family transcriptional regulator, partial [Ktedonobacterales bacterium]|nr:MerR family transcriptional regulator [Ktedonobacterales bacterium]
MSTRGEGQETRSASHSYHIGDVAALTGLTADALRAWERVGLLTPRRSSGGVRRYTEDDIARVRLIARTLQSSGFSRRVIAALLESGDLRPDAADYAPGPARTRRRSGSANDVARASGTSARDKDYTRSERRTLDAVARVGDALASG